ncbi:MAG: tRNA 2-thiocytidine(32) synthetase TtcA [Ruminococcus sp.]|nr:tRNA 2-thiocytidine(32) synthetase TtcA [Ruminococcus sp.]
MQKVLGYMRRAIQEYDLIQDGDKIAVGVSGGKDSLVLLQGLSLLRRFIGIEYSLYAITLDPQFNGESGDYSAVEEYCREQEIPFELIRTDIGSIVFDIRKEPNPCSLCARMRRGALHDTAVAAGCNKIALGHHYNDTVETFLMNLFIEGRIGCFSPKSYLSRKQLTLIRPLVFAPEKEIRRAAERHQLPVYKSKCPADGHTSRERMKQFIIEKERESHGFTDRVFGAMRRANIDGWGGVNWIPKEKEE